MSNGNSTPAPEARPKAAAPNGVSHDWLFRAAILVAVLGAVAVIWWSLVAVYFPRQKQARDLIAQVERLSSEVDDLDRQWPRAAAEAITNQFRQANTRLFDGRGDLEKWLAEVKEQAGALALDLHADLGQASTRTAGGRTLGIVPATLSVEVRPALPDMVPASPYQRILQFCQRLTDEGKQRGDLMELSLTGGTNSVTRTVLVLNYWTGREGTP
jgi:hypothetical protein